jgi:hypothetical protein
MSFVVVWSHAMTSDHWYACTVHSHALALLIFSAFWYFPRKPAKNLKILDPSQKKSPNMLRITKSQDTLLEAPPSPVASLSSESDVDGMDQNLDDLSLEKACPDATPMERRRFLTARRGNMEAAAKSLSHYLGWVKTHDNIARERNIKRPTTDDCDLDFWNEACAIAMKACGEVGEETNLPRVIRTHQLGDGADACDLQNHRIFHIIPAKMDDKLANTSTYALATALFIDKQLDREGRERIIVCLDVRAGRGLPNIHAMRLIPFMQQTTALLLSLFPERLHKCLLFPVPSSFLWIWNTIKKCIDPLTRDKICLLSGVNKIESPPPLDQMIEHMEEKVALLLESSRVASFKD